VNEAPPLDTTLADLRFMLPPEPAALFTARQRIRTHLQLSPLDPGQIDDVVLSVEEACTNAIRHSGTEEDVEVSLAFEGEELAVLVRDRGHGFDLRQYRPDEVPDPFASGGRGLFLISQLMDEVDLRIHGGVEVRMRKRGSLAADSQQYRLSDLIDVGELQGLLDSFDAAFGCPNAIVDNEAQVLTASGWQDICTQFHRVHPETLGECQQSDLHIYGHLHRGTETVAYVCPRGMIDCASPILIEGRHLGNVFIGQVFVEPPDLDSFSRQARRFGFDEEAYLEAVRRVPVLTRDELEARLPFVRGLAEMVAQLGLSRLRDRALHRELEERAAENARLYEQQRRIAETLQENLMHPLPVVLGLELGSISRTANQPELVGGDFSDVFPLDDHSVVIAIGDVAGKGVRAAGLAERVTSMMRAFATIDRSPGFILRKTNEVLLHRQDDEELVTALVAVLDTGKGSGYLSSAAHPAPVKLSRDGSHLLPLSFGPPLGSFEMQYVDVQFDLAAGEALVLYTDGLTEARRDRELFGEARLLDLLRPMADQRPGKLVERLSESVERWAGELRDDLQVLAVKCVPERRPGAASDSSRAAG
jgi:serine phosphatase RsbU (regulator of sigma subunit)/anti-sigma regulatory factor (Ser/Thr protein kinase)